MGHPKEDLHMVSSSRDWPKSRASGAQTKTRPKTQSPATLGYHPRTNALASPLPRLHSLPPHHQLHLPLPTAPAPGNPPSPKVATKAQKQPPSTKSEQQNSTPCSKIQTPPRAPSAVKPSTDCPVRKSATRPGGCPRTPRTSGTRPKSKRLISRACARN